VNHLLSKSDVVQALLQDLIGFFSQPSPLFDHEERQLRLKALRNRQDLFQEEVGFCLFFIFEFSSCFLGNDSNTNCSDKFF
jgi:hypothetical protein